MTAPCAAATCTRTLYESEIDNGQRLCTPCIRAIHTWLTAELPLQITVLAGSLQRETTGQPSGRATRTAPLPGREDILNLTGPAAWTPVHDKYGDQTGTVPIIGVLTGWVRLICEERRWDGPPVTTAQAYAAWLAHPPLLAWTARRPWAGEYRDELAGLMRTVRAASSVRAVRRAIKQPCPRCDGKSLSRLDHQLYAECGDCDGLFTRDELALAAKVAIAQLQQTA
ncbi:hypothetical protein [Streptomyces acidiscabies]|uniref:hypothetical protein n=1 Tax=Streptomyces acidiscabies TaxID=42234 RepID=UPI0009536528|nr:hypothetical protein [Streptomyces acidiscabies]